MSESPDHNTLAESFADSHKSYLIFRPDETVLLADQLPADRDLLNLLANDIHRVHWQVDSNIRYCCGDSGWWTSRQDYCHDRRVFANNLLSFGGIYGGLLRRHHTWSDAVPAIVSLFDAHVQKGDLRSASMILVFGLRQVEWLVDADLILVLKKLRSIEDFIPPKYRTKPIDKQTAGELLGRPKGRGAGEWVTKAIADGGIRAESLTRQSFVFDLRQFPESKHKYLTP